MPPRASTIGPYKILSIIFIIAIKGVVGEIYCVIWWAIKGDSGEPFCNP